MKVLKSSFVTLLLFAVAFLMGLAAADLTGSSDGRSYFFGSTTQQEPFAYSLPDHPPNFTKSNFEDVRPFVLEAGKEQKFDGYHVKLQTTIVDINSDGYRDELHSIEKPEKTTRVIGLGDSITFGWGVNQSDIWTEVLERRLNRNSERNHQVLNFGVWTYNTSIEVEMLEEKGLKYNPDSVIIQYHRNDAENNSRRSELIDKYRKEFRQKYSDSNISDRRLNIEIQKKANAESRKRRKAMPIEQSMSTVKAPFSRLANMSERNDFEVFIMEWSVRDTQSEYLKQLSDRFGFTYIDMSSQLKTYREAGNLQENPYRVADGHPNAKGHKLIAEGILNSINSTEFN